MTTILVLFITKISLLCPSLTKLYTKNELETLTVLYYFSYLLLDTSQESFPDFPTNFYHWVPIFKSKPLLYKLVGRISLENVLIISEK